MRRAATFILLSLLFFGCNTRQDSILVYTALDREFSEPIFDAFTKESGIKVRAKYDTEANKSVALANLVIAEQNRPRCDLFWNNEIVHTLRLNQKGLLRSFASRHESDFDPQFRDPEKRWHGFAARARILLVNTDKLSQEQFPTSIFDLGNPEYKGRSGIAKPLFGTTGSHAACLFAALGEKNAKDVFLRIKQNARVFAGNKQVAQAVSRGVIDFGLTDTDDAIIEIRKGYPVEIVYPDQQDQQMGTLFIPNTLGLIRTDSEEPQKLEAAESLVDFLLSPETEKRLAEGRSAQIPLNGRTKAQLQVASPKTKKAMVVDFNAAAAQWDVASEFLRQKFMTMD